MQATLPDRSAFGLRVGQDEIEVTVVMPCLNEALTVGKCVAKAVATLERLGVAGEVIVADNGSTDGSRELATAAGARVVAADRRGYGAALQAGIAAARGRFIIMGDADDSYDFTALEPFIERLRAGDDLVMGNRFMGGIRPGAMPWHHKYIGNPILSGILNLFFHTPIRDAHCGLRGFRKDAYRQLDLRTLGMEFASEMHALPVQAKTGRGARLHRTLTAAIGHRTCVVSVTAGGTCASCCSCAPCGSTSSQRLSSWALASASWRG